MPRFKVKVKETTYRSYLVEAEDEDEARWMVETGEVSDLDIIPGSDLDEGYWGIEEVEEDK